MFSASRLFVEEYFFLSDIISFFTVEISDFNKFTSFVLSDILFFKLFTELVVDDFWEDNLDCKSVIWVLRPKILEFNFFSRDSIELIWDFSFVTSVFNFEFLLFNEFRSSLSLLKLFWTDESLLFSSLFKVTKLSILFCLEFS